MKLTMKIKEIAPILIAVLIILTLVVTLFYYMATTYEYYEVELELTGDYQPYAVYYQGTYGIRFDDDDIDITETYNMEIYKARDILIPTYQFVSVRDVYIINGKAYVRYSQFRTAWGSSPLVVE